MIDIKRIFASLPDIFFFFTVFLGEISLFGTIIGIFDALDGDLEYFKKNIWLCLYIVVLQGIASGYIALYYRKLMQLTNGHEKDVSDDEEKDSLLATDLIKSLEAALNSKNYVEVIRIGSALSRPFFESGNYKARLTIGIFVEEAAACMNNASVQMSALIDSIGWSYVELGNLTEGEKKILHGLSIAEKEKNNFFISKARRHLGAIKRRSGNYSEAEIQYDKALEAADNITDSDVKIETIAGVNYAQSSLYMYTKKFDEALDYIDRSIEGFNKIGDSYRETMAMTNKANVLFLSDRVDEAKDSFRIALHNSEQRTERLQMARCYIGLSKIYIKEKNWIKAKEYLWKADKIKIDVKSASEVLDINELWTYLPKGI